MEFQALAIMARCGWSSEALDWLVSAADSADLAVIVFVFVVVVFVFVPVVPVVALRSKVAFASESPFPTVLRDDRTSRGRVTKVFIMAAIAARTNPVEGLRGPAIFRFRRLAWWTERIHE